MPKQIKDFSTKATANNADFLLMQDAITGETYKITKADLLRGLANSSEPNIPTYIALALTEVSGNTALDTSGNNRNATYVNTTLNQNGAILNSSSRISLNSSNSALTSLSIGLEFKTNATSNQGLWEFRASQDLSSGTYTPALIMNATGKLAVYGFPSGSGYTIESFNDNIMHKSIIVMTNGKIKVFVNKIKLLEVNANPITAFTGFFSIGATRANGNFSGQMKNFRAWNFELTDTQAMNFS